MSAAQGRVLVVDDKETMLSLLAKILGARYAVTLAADGKQALDLLAGREFDVVLTDVKMPGADGFAVVQAVRQRSPATEVIMMTAFASVESAVQAIKLGAYDYVQKPFDPDDVTLIVARALERKRLREQAEDLPRQVGEQKAFHEIVGRSGPMRRVLEQVQQAAKLDITVLITGESGTGKELAARAIHAHSARAGGPFVPVSCRALPPDLVESELFGPARGAFTGATATRKGLWEEAERGTLFLDEVAELPPADQVKLNRVLQDKEVRRVGENEAFPVDVRLIAATNRQLRAEVEAGRFREDLFYRLHVFPIELPPLRARRDDLPLLAQHFAEKYARIHGRVVRGFEPEALQALLAHGWPGNVRELENAIERAFAVARGERIGRDDLAMEAAPESADATLDGAQLVALPYKTAVNIARDRVSREYLAALMRSFAGNVKQAAEKAGIERESLHRLLKRHGLRSEVFREPDEPSEGSGSRSRSVHSDDDPDGR
jgi:DNA-binding NtrC family response regulator